MEIKVCYWIGKFDFFLFFNPWLKKVCYSNGLSHHITLSIPNFMCIIKMPFDLQTFWWTVRFVLGRYTPRYTVLSIVGTLQYISETMSTHSEGANEQMLYSPKWLTLNILNCTHDITQVLPLYATCIWKKLHMYTT